MIFDLSGKVVLQLKTTALRDRVKLDISNLPSGAYIINVDGVHTQVKEKLIIK